MGVQRSKLKNKSETSPNIFGKFFARKHADEESKMKSKSQDDLATVAEKVENSAKINTAKTESYESSYSSGSSESTDSNKNNTNQVPRLKELPIVNVFQNKKRRATLTHVNTGLNIVFFAKFSNFSDCNFFYLLRNKV
jgi:hypothetical protein